MMLPGLTLAVGTSLFFGTLHPHIDLGWYVGVLVCGLLGFVLNMLLERT